MIIFYDGECALCHSVVKFILKLDIYKNFKFSPLALLKLENYNYPDSLVLKINDKFYFEGEAIIRILFNLSIIGKILGLPLRVMPIKLLNIFYRIVAKSRKRWKINDKSQCPIIPEHLKDRFILSK
jgi:predicted DCC family thiol-disulfide oxidoreductase YuxK